MSPSVTVDKSTTVDAALDLKAPLASPALTGNPTAPTATAGDNDTSIATTAFVTTAVATAGGALTLKPASLHATYGDDFTGGSLDAKWTRVGYSSADEQYAQGAGSTYLQIATPRTAGNYYYQTAPSGDFTVVAAVTSLVASGGSVMFGIMAMDASGNGAGACVYTGSPFTTLVATVAGGIYNSAFQSGKGVLGPVVAAGAKHYLKLNKSGTSWKAAASANGELWGPWTPTQTETHTPVRIGFGSFLSIPDAFAVDWFDVQ